jgi:hypothetical protein
MTSLKKLAIFAAAALLGASAVRADTVWIGNGTSAIKVYNVKVTQVVNGDAQYVTDSGVTTTRALAQLSQINIDGESSFNSAENAFAARDYDTAISSYQQTLQSSTAKDWEKARAAARLLAAAKVQNRFDAEVDAYIALLQKDPAEAAQNKPSEPPANSQYLDPALSSISRALSSSTLPDEQKTSLLGLQLKINRAKGDTAQVNATLQQLVALGGGSDADKATLKVLAAQVALDAGKYSEAFDDIDQNRALFTQPDQQVDALFILAQAKQKIDGNKNDPDTLKDQALAYLRVVTFAGQLPDRPHVPESLYAAAQIEQQLNEPKAAKLLYAQIVNDKAYASSPVLPLAKAALQK